MSDAYSFGGDAPFADDARLAAAFRAADARASGASQPVPGLPQGAIPGLLGVALNGGTGSNGLPGGLWRPPANAGFAQGAPPSGMGFPAAPAAGPPLAQQAPPMPLPQPRPASAPSLATGPGSDAMAAAPPALPPMAAPAPTAPPSGGGGLIPPDSMLGRLFSNLANFRDQNRLTLLALGGGLAGSQNWGTGLSRGFQAALPAQMQDIALNRQNMTADVLTRRFGMDPQTAMAAATNPQVMSQLLPMMMGINPLQHVMMKGPLGEDIPLMFDQRSGRYFDMYGRPLGGEGGASGAPAAGGGTAGALGPASISVLAPGVQRYDPTLPADQYFAQFGPEMQAAIKSQLSGDIIPTGNPRQNSIASASKTYAMTYANKAGIPYSDTTYAEKRKLLVDLASSGPSSLGGLMSNGQSAFEHLANYSDNAVNLGSVGSTRAPAFFSHGINMAGSVFGNPNVAARITAAEDNLDRYGQESTKFYAGTGGGVEERAAARKAQDPRSTTPQEMAAFLSEEMKQMTARFDQKIAQIRRQVPGSAEADRIIAPMQADVNEKKAHIEANIAKLRGEQAPAATPTTAQSRPTVTSKADYDALQSGAEFIGADGLPYRKP